ncbi:hypothetical protein Ancab_014053 [Ancistrocladus abbreviatus]
MSSKVETEQEIDDLFYSCDIDDSGGIQINKFIVLVCLIHVPTKSPDSPENATADAFRILELAFVEEQAACATLYCELERLAAATAANEAMSSQRTRTMLVEDAQFEGNVHANMDALEHNISSVLDSSEDPVQMLQHLSFRKKVVVSKDAAPSAQLTEMQRFVPSVRQQRQSDNDYLSRKTVPGAVKRNDASRMHIDRDTNNTEIRVGEKNLQHLNHCRILFDIEPKT